MFDYKSRLSSAALLSGLALFLCAGCGEVQPNTYPASGKVTFSDGSIVRTGMVELESTDHKVTASGRIQQDGSFVLGTFTATDGAVAGPHRAIVVQMIVNDGFVRHSVDHGAPVDALFGSYNTSPLKVQIIPDQTNAIELVVEKSVRR